MINTNIEFSTVAPSGFSEKVFNVIKLREILNALIPDSGLEITLNYATNCIILHTDSELTESQIESCKTAITDFDTLHTSEFDALILQTRRRIDIHRDTQISSGFIHSLDGEDIFIETREQDRLNWSEFKADARWATSNNEEFTLNWIMKDDSIKTLSKEQVLEVAAAMQTHFGTQMYKANGLKTAINSLTVEQLKEYDVVSSWP